MVIAGTFMAGTLTSTLAEARISPSQEYRVTCTGASNGNWILDVSGLMEALDQAGACFDQGGSASISPIYRW